MSSHNSYYINVGQIMTVAIGGLIAWRALRLEEAKAGMQKKSLIQVIREDVDRFCDWLNADRIEIL